MTGEERHRDDWTAAWVEEVAPGVHRIPLPLPNDNLRAVNVYAVIDGDGLLLVDAGWAVANARERLEDALGVLGCGLADIHRFVVTHAHRDHYTLAVTLRRELLIPVSLGVGERPSLQIIKDPGRLALHPQLEALNAYGAGELVAAIAAGMAGHERPDRSEWEYPDAWLEDGEVVRASGRELTVVATPGHTRGHVVFHDAASRLLFAGDHVLPRITPSIGFEPILSPNPLGDFLGSLARVREMPDAMLLPAHGPVAPSVHARVDELVDHHGRRLDETYAGLVAGAETAFEVACRLRWTRRGRRIDELDLFNQMLAVAETGAHLALLIAQGRADRVLDGEAYRYYAAA